MNKQRKKYIKLLDKNNGLNKPIKSMNMKVTSEQNFLLNVMNLCVYLCLCNYLPNPPV